MRIKLFVVSIAFLTNLQAQDSSFTLKQSLDLAIKQNLDIQIAQSDLEIATINNNWGNAGALPVVTGNIGNSEARTNINQKLANGSSIERNNVANSSINANIGVSWRVFNGFRIRATKNRFDVLEKMGEMAVKQQIDQIIFNVTNVYYNLVRLNKQIKATKAIIELSKERLKIAETRFNVGSGAKTDMLQAGIDLNAQLVNLNRILNQVENTKAGMNALLQRNPNTPFHTSDNDFAIVKIDFNNLMQKLESQNNLLQISAQEKINLLNERKIINSQRLPSITLNTSTVLNRSKSTAGFFLTNQTFGPNIGLAVGVPIFNGNVNKTQLKVNEIQVKQQANQQENLKTNLQRDLLIAYQDYLNAIENAKIEENNVKLAEENNMISTERFRKLQSNSIELRQAQLSLIEAQDRFIDAQFQAQIAVSTLLFMSGEISKY
jgi:outer membrane protein TolC